MREYKFRAWDKEYKMMSRVEVLTLEGCFLSDLPKGQDIDNQNRYISVAPDKGQFRKFKNVELMQYTGLKDKNGKEIYEGDILEYDVWRAYIEYGYYAFGSDNFLCFHMKYIYHSLKDETDCIGKWVSEKYEVIGNIYENKELLNDTKKNDS